MQTTKKQIREASDKPIAALVQHAQNAIKSWQGNAGMTPRVIFKHTCGECGQRGFIEAPNTVPATVECERCANIQPYEKGGYSLAFELQGVSPHGYTDSDSRAVTFATPEKATVTKCAPSAEGMPTKVGCRMEKSGTLTPVDKEALAQFGATLLSQELLRAAK